MKEYAELDYDTNYNPKVLSANISCKSMSSLSSAYTTQQNNLFADRINMDIFNYHNNFHRDIDALKESEYELLSGFSINKKSCIYKRPEYNDGTWKEQYQSSDTFKNNIETEKDRYKLFDYQTKNKTKVIPK
jgi:hypothetical protein|uniref:Uncharacterized protein n=1 Tax=viral metagenome TaxID=1070528 RepID=A0A6C0LA91_9ZZZZ